MGLLWWQNEFIQVDLTGATRITNTYPFSQNLDSTATLRRYIGDFWFTVENIHAPYEEQVARGGVEWAIILWPADGTFPAAGTLIGSLPITQNDRFIGFGYTPGGLASTNEFGAKTYRFPADGSPIHLDVQAQRKPAPDPANAPWNPWLSWSFKDAPIGSFDGVTHLKIHAEFGFLMDRPPHP